MIDEGKNISDPSGKREVMFWWRSRPAASWFIGCRVQRIGGLSDQALNIIGPHYFGTKTVKYVT